MAHKRVGRGGTITLEATFQEGSGALVDPTTPRVDLIDPVDTEVVTDAVPTQDAVGLYHYDYEVPVDAPLGVWTAHWTGVINGSPVADDDSFEVTEAGVIEFPGVGWPTLEELASYLQTTITEQADIDRAELALELAIGEVQAYTGQRIEYVGDETVTLDGSGSPVVLLPEIPVVEVASVTLDGDVLDASGYTWDAEGILRAGGSWPSPPRTLEVIYSHGYPEIPEAIRSVVLKLAARIYTSGEAVAAVAAGIRSESVGSYSVTYADRSGASLEDADRAALDRYRAEP